MICVTWKKSSLFVANGSSVSLTSDARKVRTPSSSIMAWVTTSSLNGMTKWHGPGHAAYDEAATALGHTNLGDDGTVEHDRYHFACHVE